MYAAAKSAPLRRHGPLLLAVVLLAASLGWPAFAMDAVILNSDDDSLSIIDTSTYKETARTHIGRAPHHLMPTPDGKISLRFKK